MRRAALLPPPLHLLLAGVVLVACSVTPRATLASRGPRPREDTVCCGLPVPPAPESREGPSGTLPSLGQVRPPGPGHPGPDPKLCCGKGWGLHCCLGGACCLGDRVVPTPTPLQPPMPTGRSSLRDTLPWKWKDWAQWLNIIVVILIVALVSAVMVCCWRRNRLIERNPLRVTDAHILSYGAVPGYRASAPYWKSPTSHWVDFSYVPASGAPHRTHSSPYYKPASTVNYFASHPAEM